MCGIVGYVGKKNATPFLLEGLAALEYRGYDSSGLYVAGAGVHKSTGKVQNLTESVPKDFKGKSGIAHTRWATHGPPTLDNAHPHHDAAGRIWLVHNGIIENYRELKHDLEQTGTVFCSETDTEVLAQLIGKKYQSMPSLEMAVAAALQEVRGPYGIAVMAVDDPEKVVVARRGSPLLIGIGQEEYFVASDATPLLPHTRQVIYLKDGELAVLTPQGYAIQSLDKQPVEATIETLEWDHEAAEKQGFAHFMLKEIMEIPEVLENTMRGRLDLGHERIQLGGLRDVEEALRKAKRFIIVGCGSAYYAGLVGELLIEELAGIPVEVEIASEFRYRRLTASDDTVVIAVSQSGETADTLEAVREAKRHGLLTLGIVNAVGSSIARETDAGVYNHAGPEIGVASTKAFVSQLTVFVLLALHLKQLRSDRSDQRELFHELSRLPDYARHIVEHQDEIARIAATYASAEHMLFIGRKFQYPIAYEGALKMKEVSYLHAEAYGAGELKHGPLALIDSRTPTVVLAPRDSMFEKTLSNAEEINARGGPIIALTTEGSSLPCQHAVMTIPKTHEALLPILSCIPLQLLAYYVALHRNLPIDTPRNLAKSVTVE